MMDYKFHEQLQKFLDSEHVKTEEDLQKAMDKFNNMSGALDNYDFELSPMAQAYEYLDKAQTAN